MTVLTDQERIARLEFVVGVLLKQLPGNEALTEQESSGLIEALTGTDLLPVPAYLRKPK